MDIKNKKVLENPSKLIKSILFVFADLKKYIFEYQFAVPSIQTQETFIKGHKTKSSYWKKIEEENSNNENGSKLIHIQNSIKGDKVIIKNDPKTWEIFENSNISNIRKSLKSLSFHEISSSDQQNPSEFIFQHSLMSSAFPYYSENQLIEIGLEWEKLKKEGKDVSIFIIEKDKNENKIYIKEFKEVINLYKENKNITIAFIDSSNLKNKAGGLLRNLILTLSFLVPEQKYIKFIGIRSSFVHNLEALKRWTIYKLLIPTLTEEQRNSDEIPGEIFGKTKSRQINLSSSMDSLKLAESQVYLNLKLIKWRTIPQLDLDSIFNTKVLLFGAGTLGCNVARTLVGWGVRNITFVDNSKVSFSNPVRQTLFTYQDCLHGGKFKAEAAAEHLREIFPSCNTVGYNLSIPMPGHTIPNSLKEKFENDLETITNLIKDHDVIFLLTDNRESRWLPTVISASLGKICISTALGFDTFLIIRHGHNSLFDYKIENKEKIETKRLGCYFCSNTDGPVNSMIRRTLDQQCTVTRPGISMIAASLAVELMTSLISHPLKILAPSENDTSDFNQSTPSLLGICPHQIRGFLSHFYNGVSSIPAYDKCSGCSESILNKYNENPKDFVWEACNNHLYIEQVCGLDKEKEQDPLDVIEFDDEEILFD